MGRRRRRGQLNSASTTTTIMLAEAEELLRQGRAEDALPVALRALDDTLRQTAADRDTTVATTTTTAALPALNSIAAIYLELGNAASARSYFLRAASVDPNGQIPYSLGGGAEKFLWLAQLSEEGGQDSVEWFERGAAILRRETGAPGEGQEGKREKLLAGALCGMIEVYMTDLCWCSSAEGRCERLISEALLVAPHSAGPLQTLASIRISQSRVAEAQRALKDSMALWRDVGTTEEEGDEDDDAVPDFATRISLCRLLMEVEMEEEALGVVERLVQEDDGSVEAWYLGGWCLYLLGAKQRLKHEGSKGVDGGVVMEDGNRNLDVEEGGEGEDLYTQSMVSSREWLRQGLKLYETVEYEDERLRDHAMELVEELDAIIGEEGDDEIDGGEEERDGFGEDDEEERDDETMDEG